MKNFIKSIRLTLVFCLFFSVFYILILWIFAQFAGPNSGNAEVATLDGKVVGAANVGQVFTEDIYFWGRPSCAGDGYDASSSAGSNKGHSFPTRRSSDLRILGRSRNSYRHLLGTPPLFGT